MYGFRQRESSETFLSEKLGNELSLNTSFIGPRTFSIALSKSLLTNFAIPLSIDGPLEKTAFYGDKKYVFTKIPLIEDEIVEIVETIVKQHQTSHLHNTIHPQHNAARFVTAPVLSLQETFKSLTKCAEQHPLSAASWYSNALSTFTELDGFRVTKAPEHKAQRTYQQPHTLLLFTSPSHPANPATHTSVHKFLFILTPLSFEIAAGLPSMPQQFYPPEISQHIQERCRIFTPSHGSSELPVILQELASTRSFCQTKTNADNVVEFRLTNVRFNLNLHGTTDMMEHVQFYRDNHFVFGVCDMQDTPSVQYMMKHLDVLDESLATSHSELDTALETLKTKEEEKKPTSNKLSVFSSNTGNLAPQSFSNIGFAPITSNTGFSSSNTGFGASNTGFGTSSVVAPPNTGFAASNTTFGPGTRLIQRLPQTALMGNECDDDLLQGDITGRSAQATSPPVPPPVPPPPPPPRSFPTTFQEQGFPFLIFQQHTTHLDDPSVELNTKLLQTAIDEAVGKSSNFSPTLASLPDGVSFHESAGTTHPAVHQHQQLHQILQEAFVVQFFDILSNHPRFHFLDVESNYTHTLVDYNSFIIEHRYNMLTRGVF